MKQLIERLKHNMALIVWDLRHGSAMRRFNWFGFCPECNSDAPEMDTCKVCGAGKVPRQFIRINYMKKNKHPNYANKTAVRKQANNTANPGTVSRTQ